MHFLPFSFFFMLLLQMILKEGTSWDRTFLMAKRIVNVKGRATNFLPRSVTFESILGAGRKKNEYKRIHY